MQPDGRPPILPYCRVPIVVREANAAAPAVAALTAIVAGVALLLGEPRNLIHTVRVAEKLYLQPFSVMVLLVSTTNDRSVSA